ncbi:cytochrome P450 monooxygenase [Sparassis latifolia]
MPTPIQETFTPGVVYLVGVISRLLLPPCATYTVLGFLQGLLGLQITKWILILSCTSSLPALAFARSLWRHFREEREIRALGAVRVPALRGRWPGNVDFILRRVKTARDGYPLEELQEFTQQVGKIFSINIMGEQRIVTSDPTHIKTILATEFNNWEKGAVTRRQNMSVFGTGVFNADGEMFHRSMTRPYFNRDRITDFETFGRHADEAISAARARALCGAAIDFQDLVSRFTLDSATDFLLGSCVHSLYAVIPPVHGAPAHISHAADAFANALMNVQHGLAQRSRMSPIWPLFEIFGDRTRYIGALCDSKDIEAPHHTLLDELTDVTDDLRVISDETFNILLAGRDTTAGTLTFMTYLLAEHPPVLQRLRAEILAQVGPTRYPDFDDMREMKYLRAVINETLRIFPSVPANARSPIKSTTLPPLEPGGKPFYIPKGTRGMYIVMNMHKDKDLWGPDADEFDPDRFLDDRLTKYLVPNPFIFLPFNAGPRICLGQQFAYNEMSFFMVRLLQAFDHIELAPDAQPTESRPPASWATSTGRKAVEKIRPKSELTMYVQGGLWLRFGEAACELS